MNTGARSIQTGREMFVFWTDWVSFMRSTCVCVASVWRLTATYFGVADTRARALSLSAAFKVLIYDEDFATLLRAEQMETMPKFLAERARLVA